MADFRAFLDITIDGRAAGRIVIKLYNTPVSNGHADHFRAFCTGERGIGLDGNPLHYRGRRIGRVFPFCGFQGGHHADDLNFDISSVNAAGDAKPLKPVFVDQFRFFMDDNVVGTESPFFYINTGNIWTFVQHVNNAPILVCGEVVEGADVVKLIEAEGDSNGRPNHEIVISDCGVLP